MNKKFVSIFLCILFTLSCFRVFAAQICTPEIDKYTLKDNVNVTLSRLQMGDKCNISIDIKDKSIKSSEITDINSISIVGVDGSFGSPDPESISINSDGENELEYTILFKDIVYSGTGNTMSFKIRYKNLNLTSEKLMLKIIECSEADIDSDDYQNETDSQGQTNSLPYIEISRGDITEPIKANEYFEILFIVKNRGAVEIEKPYITISLPSSISSAESIGNKKLPDIKPGGSTKFTLKLRAENYIESSSEEIEVAVNYNYNKNEVGTYTDKIFIPMEATKKAATPIIQIIREPIKKPVEANEEFILPITVKNIGETAVSSALISFAISDELMFLEDNTSIELDTLNPNSQKNLSLRLKAKNKLSQPVQEINSELKYNYKSSNEWVQASESAKLIVPSQPNDDKKSEPLIQIIPDDLPSPIESGKSFSTSVLIKNIGLCDINNALIVWEASDGLIITDKTASANIGDIKVGESKKIDIKAKTADKLSSSQNITGELKYNYKSEDSIERGTESIKITIPTIADKEEDKTIKKITPNIIADSYSYGGVPVANGSYFDFNVVFKNTSKDTYVENIVMTIETGEGVNISSASNTYFYERLNALGKKSENVRMQVLPAAESGSVSLTLNFKYEYVDNNERNQITSSQNVSIPVYKPDKLEITLEPISAAVVGGEQTITMNYVNKGKGELSNVKAEISDDITALTSVQNLGNFEPGKSGSINFVVVPDTPGEIKFDLTVSYEDANMEQKSQVFPCVMNVEDFVPEPPMEDFQDNVENEKHFPTKIIVIIGIVIFIIVVIIFIFIIKKRKKNQKNLVKVDWEA